MDDDDAPPEHPGRSLARDGAPMGFLDHLEELRGVLVRSILAFALAVALVAFFLRDATAFLNQPFVRALGEGTQDVRMVTTSPMAVFTAIIYVVLVGGLALSLPFILYFIGRFVQPALYTDEERMLRPFCLGAFLLFLGGAAFSYYLLVPTALEVSVRLNRLLGLEMVWSWETYYSLVVWLILIMGLTFQFPLVIVILVHIGVLSVERLRSARRLMVVIFFVLAAFITPTADPLTQGMVAGPMIVLYELSIRVSVLVERRRLRALERALTGEPG